MPMSDQQQSRSRYLTGLGNPLNSDPSEVTAIRAPILFADKWRTIFGGGFMLLLAPLGIPLLIVAAFLAELAEADITGRQTSVQLLHFTHTIRDAFRAVSVSILLFAPVIGLWILYGGAAMIFEVTDGIFLFSTLFEYLVLALTISLTMLAVYAFPAVFILSVHLDSATKPFGENLIATVISPHYLLAWLMSVLMLIGGLFLWLISLIIPILGVLIGTSIFFYSLCVATIFMARAVIDSPAVPTMPFTSSRSAPPAEQQSNSLIDYKTRDQRVDSND